MHGYLAVVCASAGANESALVCGFQQQVCATHWAHDQNTPGQAQLGPTCVHLRPSRYQIMVEARLAYVLVWHLPAPLRRLKPGRVLPPRHPSRAEWREVRSGAEYNTANATEHLHECSLAFASGQVAALEPLSVWQQSFLSHSDQPAVCAAIRPSTADQVAGSLPSQPLCLHSGSCGIFKPRDCHGSKTRLGPKVEGNGLLAYLCASPLSSLLLVQQGRHAGVHTASNSLL